MRISTPGIKSNISIFQKVQASTTAVPSLQCAWTAADTTASAAPLGVVQLKAMPHFSMKGGFIGSGAQRRMVIVGKIGRF